MIVELISTGSELLLGDTVNTNVSWLAQELNKLGYTVAYQSVVGDNRLRMQEVLRIAMKRADIIITTGGLGPTQGDITREVVASAIDVPLECNEDAMNEIKAFFHRVNRDMPEASRREAMLPSSSNVLHNPVGVAPGVALQDKNSQTTFILLPGPPEEMKGMFVDSVIPYLEHTFGVQGNVHSYRYAIYGLRELELERTVADLVASQSNPTIALLIKKGYIELRITAHGKTVDEAKQLLAPWDAIIRERLGHHVGRELHTSMDELLASALLTASATVSTAESCTSGLVGKRLTDLAGSSAYYNGGIISYTNTIKHNLLHVPQELLDTVGAVSREVAQAMAEGTRRITNSTYGISTTGLAGPGGGTKDKPVGLVYIGVAGPNGTVVHKLELIGNRDDIRQSAAEYALYYLYEYMKEVH